MTIFLAFDTMMAMKEKERPANRHTRLKPHTPTSQIIIS